MAITEKQTDPGIIELVRSAAADTTELVKQQIELTKAEVKESVKTAGSSFGMIAVGLFILLLGVIFLLVTLAYVLVQLGLQVWAGFGIVTLVLLLVGGIIALVGIRRSKTPRPRTFDGRPRGDQIHVQRLTGASCGHAVRGDPRAGAVDPPTRSGQRCAVPPRRGGPGPLVILLHGFPQFWWTWREYLPALAAAGYRAAAMDLRGYGGSDHSPRGYDPTTLSNDVLGVIACLGEPSAVIVGHGWGAHIGWTAARRSRMVTGLTAISAPTRCVYGSRRASSRSSRRGGTPCATSGPWLAGTGLRHGQCAVCGSRRSWSPGRSSGGGSPRGLRPLPGGVPHRQHRALRDGVPPMGLAQLRARRWPPVQHLDGRGSRSSNRSCIHGRQDPTVLAATTTGSGDYVAGPRFGADRRVWAFSARGAPGGRAADAAGVAGRARVGDSPVGADSASLHSRWTYAQPLDIGTAVGLGRPAQLQRRYPTPTSVPNSNACALAIRPRPTSRRTLYREQVPVSAGMLVGGVTQGPGPHLFVSANPVRLYCCELAKMTPAYRPSRVKAADRQVAQDDPATHDEDLAGFVGLP